MPSAAVTTPPAMSVPVGTRRASTGATRKLMVEVTIPGSSPSAAAMGERCNASWKNCATNSIVVPPSMLNSSIPPSAVRNAFPAKSRRSSSGSSSVRCRFTKTYPTAIPATRAATGSGRTPSRASSLTP